MRDPLDILIAIVENTVPKIRVLWLPHGTKSEASAGFPHGTKAKQHLVSPLFKGDGRGIYKGDGRGIYKGDGRGIYKGDGRGIYKGNGRGIYKGNGRGLGIRFSELADDILKCLADAGAD